MGLFSWVNFTSKGEVAEWFKAVDCKSMPQGRRFESCPLHSTYSFLMPFFIFLIVDINFIFFSFTTSILSVLAVLLFFKEEVLFLFFIPYFKYFYSEQIVLSKFLDFFIVYLLLLLPILVIAVPFFIFSFYYYLIPFIRKGNVARTSTGCFLLLPLICFTFCFGLFHLLLTSTFRLLPRYHYLFSFVFDLSPYDFFYLFFTVICVGFLLLLIFLYLFYFLPPINHFSTIRVFLFVITAIFALIFLPSDPLLHAFVYSIILSISELFLFFKTLFLVYRIGRVA